MTSHTTIAGATASGTSASNAPNPVATPLPPRKRRKTDQQLPTTAATAQGAAAPPLTSPPSQTAQRALGDVADQGEGGRPSPQRAQHVGCPDVPAAVATDVAEPEGARHEKADGDGADQVGEDDPERRPHDQRSSSGTIAR